VRARAHRFMLSAVDDSQLTRRFELIEQQLRVISEHLGVPCPAFAGDGVHVEAPAGEMAVATVSGPASSVPAEVVELARAGKSIQAISALRRLTGASLVEAKRVVDPL
jgi:ribosomal protein L7/L12